MPLDEQYSFFSEHEKNEISYGTCLGGFSALGIAVGGIVPVVGPISLGLAGFVYGLISCRSLTPAIKQKIFKEQAQLSKNEVNQVIQSIRRLEPLIDKNEAIFKFAELRRNIALRPWYYKNV